MASFVAPLVMALTGHLPVDPVFAAIAAQGIALVDVRGAYALRLSLLLAMSCILAAAAALGTVADLPLTPAELNAMLLMAS